MRFNGLLSLFESTVSNALAEPFESVSSRIDDEILLTVSEKQINDALYKFVTRNVKAILEMRIELHDGWFRLFCTANIAGIHAKVAGNFKLVHIRLDRYHQRLVFAQQGNTDILELYATSYLKKFAIEKAIPLFRKITGKDPLGLILRRIQLARVKDNIFYVDIGRWLRKSEKIMTNLYKFQINYGYVADEQLVLKGQINYRDLLANNASGDLISENDNPNKAVANIDYQAKTDKQNVAKTKAQTN